MENNRLKKSDRWRQKIRREKGKRPKSFFQSSVDPVAGMASGREIHEYRQNTTRLINPHIIAPTSSGQKYLSFSFPFFFLFFFHFVPKEGGSYNRKRGKGNRSVWVRQNSSGDSMLAHTLTRLRFQGANKHRYKWVCPSVRLSVHPLHRVVSIGSCFITCYNDDTGFQCNNPLSNVFHKSIFQN